MPWIRLTVDKQVHMDQDIGEWTNTPPPFIRDRLKPGTVIEPWMKSVMITLNDALMAGQAVDINVRTGKDRWTMSVGKYETPAPASS